MWNIICHFPKSIEQLGYFKPYTFMICIYGNVCLVYGYVRMFQHVSNWSLGRKHIHLLSLTYLTWSYIIYETAAVFGNHGERGEAYRTSYY